MQSLTPSQCSITQNIIFFKFRLQSLKKFFVFFANKFIEFSVVCIYFNTKPLQYKVLTTKIQHSFCTSLLILSICLHEHSPPKNSYT
jgi:hypothetical protein